MKVLLNTGRHVEAGPELRQQVQDAVDAGLERFSDRLTRVEVHISDQNADRSGSSDLRCAMQARPSGRLPVGVSHDAATAVEACSGAVEKLVNLLSTAFGREETRRGRSTVRRP